MSINFFYAKQFFDGVVIKPDVYFSVNQSKITEISQSKFTGEIINLNGLVSPGFIDTQVNGGGGYLFNQHPSLDCIKKIMQTHHQFGTTALLPTLISDGISVIKKAADAVSAAIESQLAGMLGVHFEGPHLSQEKRGIHPQKHIREISDAELTEYCRKDIGQVVLTIAPEIIGVDIIKDLTKNGVIVSLGHSNANAEQVQAALEAGARGFTHLFNAMSPMQSREPGMVGSALLHQQSFCGLIIDLHHVHKKSCQLAINCKGAKKIMLVSDAMHHLGSQQASLNYFDTLIYRNGDKLTLTDGTLAGSVLDMATAVRNCHKVLGINLPDCLTMASKTPAKFLGCKHRGELSVGKTADFVVLDKNLNVQQTWVAGEKVFSKK